MSDDERQEEGLEAKERWQMVLDALPHVLFQLRKLDKAAIRIPEAGIKVVAYYNCPNVIRLELQRTDKRFMFLSPLDIEL